MKRPSFRTALVAWLVLACLPLACIGAARAYHTPGHADGPDKPQRIMSANMCSDILLLMLVPKERIVSITRLAHAPVAALLPGADRGVAINHGTAEEVVRDRPDLILASPWSTATMRKLAAKVGAPVVEIDSANSFADIRRIVRQTGRLVGEPERAEVLIADMDRKLARLEATKPTRPIDVAVWNGSGSVPGEGTLTDEIIRSAGARNIAAKFPDTRYSSYSIEELLVARPDALMRGVDRYDAPSLRDSAGEHPLIRSAYRNRRVTYPDSLYTCGLPQSADAAIELREVLMKTAPGKVPW
ncbi:MAG: ABC transporter substrate-binding protein [Candidatus Andeanibacterium colombiense]|uniref:ABC transporter substrate-binding protein n=1 Tax=Candidatus Andeanibacterium colombiense TaxID=3121345 RepID=A0AAJ5X1F5_9SPHN|nr:MAG: ABC transporter substrate-binding protein [Sphingomonadaceae bacterium]